MTTKYARLLLLNAALLFSGGTPALLADDSVPDKRTIRFINANLVDPGHTWASYHGIADGLKSANRELRFFAVQAGLGLAAFRDEALGIALADADPGILNLGLAALERGYEPRFRDRLAFLVLDRHPAGLPALALLARHDLVYLASLFESLFRRGTPAVQDRLLSEVASGRIVMSAPTLLSLLDAMVAARRVAVLRVLAATGQGDAFVAEFARWDGETQHGLVVPVAADAELCRMETAGALFAVCRLPEDRRMLRAALFAARNPALRRMIGETLLTCRDMSAARGFADEIIALGGAEDAVSRYARAVVLVESFAANQDALRGYEQARTLDLRRLAGSLRAEPAANSVRVIGRLREDAGITRQLVREHATLRDAVRSYLSSDEALRFKFYFRDYLAAMQFEF